MRDVRSCNGWRLLVLVIAVRIAALSSSVQAATAFDLLGSGYNSELGTLRSPCVQGSVNVRGLHQSDFEQTLDARFSSTLEQMSGQLTVKVNVLIASAKAKGSYFAKNATSDRALTATTAFRIQYGAAVLDRAYPSEKARMALGQGATALFRECGDRFVQRVSLGAGLFVNATMHFASREDVERFKLTVKVKALGGLVKKKKTWKKETASFSETAVMQINAYQEGGTPEALAEILANAPNNGACRLQSSEPCIELLERLLTYASSEDGFVSQFRDENGGLLVEHVVPMELHTERYDYAMMRDYQAKVVPSTTTPELLDLLERVAGEIAKQYGLLGRIEVLGRLADSQQRRQTLNGAEATCLSNVEKLRRAQAVCETASSRVACERAIEQAFSALHPVPTELFELEIN